MPWSKSVWPKNEKSDYIRSAFRYRFVAEKKTFRQRGAVKEDETLPGRAVAPGLIGNVSQAKSVAFFLLFGLGHAATESRIINDGKF